MSWDRRLVAEMKYLVRLEVHALADSSSPDASKPIPLVDRLLERVYALCADRTPDDPELLRAFLLLVTACSSDVPRRTIGAYKLHQLMEIAEGILITAGIKPETSELSFLYSDLYLVRSQMAQADGQRWTAVGYELAGEVQSRRGSKKRYQLHMLASAARSAQLGLYTLAAEGYQAAENHMPLSGIAFERARLGRIHSLRCSGKVSDALGLILHSQRNAVSWSDAASLELIWEKNCCGAVNQGSAAKLIGLVQEDPHYQPAFLLEAWLWALCDKTRLPGSLPAIRTLKNKFGAALSGSPQTKAMLAVIQAVSEAYDVGFSLARRILTVSESLDIAAAQLTPDRQALAYGAAARWATRTQISKLAAIAGQEYESLSLKMTQGQTFDATGLLSDLAGRGDLAGLTANSDMQWEQRQIKSLKTGFFERLWQSGRISVKVAKTLAGTSRKHRDGVNIKDHTTIVELARFLRDEMGDLKGPVMKFGQMLSVMELDIPDEAKTILSGLQHSTSFLDLEELKPVIVAELGRPVESVFANISPIPLASASIGQVHRATLLTGEEVVVKIQYPGIDRIVANDLKAARFIKPFLKALWPSANFTEILAEISERMQDETDYRMEAKNQAEFGAIFQGDSHIRIPTVYPHASGQRILTTEYIEGDKIERFTVRASQQQRDLAGETIFRFLQNSMFNHKMFNADPHPGNMIFTGNQVAFLDFGCVKRYEPTFLENWKNLIRSTVEQDETKNREYWDALGYVVDKKRFDYQFQYRFYIGMICWLFVLDKKISIDEFEHVSRIGPGQILINKNSRYMNIPRDHTFTIRLFFGMNGILRQLGSEVNWRRVAMPVFYGPDESTWPAAIDYETVKKFVQLEDVA